MPCFMFDSFNFIGISDYDTCIAEIATQGSKAWDSDKDRVFWLGACTHPNRGRVHDIVATRPDLFEIRMMSWNHNTVNESSFVSHPAHAKYSTLLDIEGAGYSGRLKLLAFANRPLIVLDRDHWDWAASILKPDEHYILGARDGSDLISIAERIRDDRAAADAMAARCAAFAQANLTRAKAIEQTARIMLD